jgi:hypothetical protein
MPATPENPERKTVEAKVAKVKLFTYEVNGHTTVETTITLETGDKFTTHGGTFARTFNVGDFLKVSFGGHQRVYFHKHDEIVIEKKEPTPSEVWRGVIERAKKQYEDVEFKGRLTSDEFAHYGIHQEPECIEFTERHVLDALEHHDYVKTEGLSLEAITEILVPSIRAFGWFVFGGEFKIGSTTQFKARATYCVATAIKKLKESGSVSEYQGRYYDNRE